MKQTSTRRRFWWTLRLIAIILCVLSLLYIGYVCYARYRERQEYSRLAQEVVTLEEVKNAEFTGERDGDAPKLPAEFSNPDRTAIDFKKLQTYNPELIAWIHVPDTNIDYPVARHEGKDQEYYLYHDMYGKPAFSASIYMEKENRGDFTDTNTVLYGHNMRNGSMFHDLHKFGDPEFFKKHTEFYIYIPGHRLKYTVFASYSTDNVKLTAAYDFSEEKDFTRYLKSLQDIRSMDTLWRDDISLTKKDKLVTLSTCIGGQPDRRYLVQGVLTDDRQTE